MLYTELTKKAMRIAYEAHKDQTDKVGVPYIFHPYHVAEQMKDELSVAAALLHDVVEDTPLTFEDLAQEGICEEVLDIVRLLTHEEDVGYMDYVQTIKDSRNERAIAIKLADLEHNSDTTRFKKLNEKALARIKKYEAARAVLLK